MLNGSERVCFLRVSARRAGVGTSIWKDRTSVALPGP